MKKLSGLLAMFLMSAGANAAQQLSYSGQLTSGTGSFQAGNAFSGQFTFNPLSPDQISFSQQTPPYTGLVLRYLNNLPASVAINGGQPVVGDGKVTLGFDDDENVTQAVIDDSNLSGVVTPGIYDMVNLFDANLQFNGTEFDGMIFGVFAAFAADTFTIEDIQNQNYQRILNLDLQPLAVFFRFENLVNGVAADRGIGLINQYSITTVPLPGAAWLFGSALAGLAFRSRKSV